MGGYILRRLLLTLAVMATVSVLSFGLVHLAGDPAVAVAGEQASAEDIARIRVQFGYDRPLAAQYVTWLGRVLHGDLGYSYYLKRDAGAVLMERLPVTAALAVGAISVALLIALPLGILAGIRPGGAMDRAALAISVASQSLPNFMVAFLLMLIFGIKLRWLPISGVQDGRGLIMPVVALGIYATPALLRLMRAEILGVMDSDYVRLAQAKGLPYWQVVCKHALRNALGPVVALSAVQLGHLLSGAIVVETIFSIQGMGNLAWQSIQRSDFEMMQALMLLTALVYALLALSGDVLNAILNPRLRTR